MDSTPDITELSKAVALAQAKFKTAVKNKKNPHFGSKYADLDAIMDAVREPLGQHGLAVLQGISTTPERFICITTRLLHASGQWIESAFSIKPDRDGPQQIGSVITYGRRYAIAAMLGITADEDDDGNAAAIEDERLKLQAALKLQGERLRAESERDEAERAKSEITKRKMAFAAKCAELGVDQKFWREIADRLHQSNRTVGDIQAVLTEMEHERAAATQTTETK